MATNNYPDYYITSRYPLRGRLIFVKVITVCHQKDQPKK
jgi:hypothetical protein